MSLNEDFALEWFSEELLGSCIANVWIFDLFHWLFAFCEAKLFRLSPDNLEAKESIRL